MSRTGIATLRAVIAGAACFALTGCGPDPIIGNWEHQSGQAKVTLDLQANGTGKHALSGMEAELQRRLGGRELPQAAKDALQRNSSQPFTWKKEGDAYRLEGASFQRGPATGKLNGTQLTLTMGAQSLTFTKAAGAR